MDGRINVVAAGLITDTTRVREQYRRLQPLAQLRVELRGWTLDVLRVVRRFNKPNFSLADVYAYEHDLERLHPNNRHVRDKIRQQLQRLRDLGLIEFSGRGVYTVVDA